MHVARSASFSGRSAVARTVFAAAALVIISLTAPGAAPSADPAKIIRIAFPVAESTFDPLDQRDIYSAAITEAVFDAMLQYDYLARPPKLIPNTLEGMPQINTEGTEYTFRLRRGIYFNDDPAFNGARRELTAQDYAYSLRRHFDPRWRSPWLFQFEKKIVGADDAMERAKKTGKFDYDAPIEGIEVVDRYTLRIRLTQPDFTFVYVLATPPSAAMAREVVERYGDDIAAHPVGTGPFRLAEWKRASKIVLEASPGFRSLRFDAAPGDDAESQAIYARNRGKLLPLIGRIEYAVVEESQPRWLAFVNGELDVLERVPNEYINLAVPNGSLAPNLAKRGISAHRGHEPSLFFTVFNMQDPVVGGYTAEKIALRRAISFGYDRDAEIAVIRKREAVPAEQPIGPGVAGFDPDFRNPMNGYDPARAKALLDLFGYIDRDGDGYRERPEGSPLSIEYASTPTLLDRQYDELWKRSMDAIGIRFTFRKATWPDLLKAGQLGKLQMRTIGWLANIPDADNFLQLLYGPNAGQSNDSRFSLEAYDRIYRQAKRLPDSPERNRLFHELSRLAVAYAPWKLGIYRIETHLAQPWVSGYKPHPTMRSVLRYVDVDLEKQRAFSR
ncbi:MAG: ABC transporter substrate-binding protein [Betaproteobacteria bacterium]|nr:ABC transporter substrate-binding protein [Betaproteobacteria bacterium]